MQQKIYDLIKKGPRKTMLASLTDIVIERGKNVIKLHKSQSSNFISLSNFSWLCSFDTIFLPLLVHFIERATLNPFSRIIGWVITEMKKCDLYKAKKWKAPRIYGTGVENEKRNWVSVCGGKCERLLVEWGGVGVGKCVCVCVGGGGGVWSVS